MATGLAALPATAATANYAEDEDTVPVGLGGLSAEDTEGDAPEMSLAAMRSRQRQARSALEEAFKLGEERLLSARGPSKFERSLALSEELSKPTMPGAAGTIGALAAAMRKYEQGGRESAEALADKRATFALDKAKSLAGSDAEYDKLIAQYMKPRPLRSDINPVTGKLTNLDTGEVIEPQGASAQKSETRFVNGTGADLEAKFGVSGLDPTQTYSLDTASGKVEASAVKPKLRKATPQESVAAGYDGPGMFDPATGEFKPNPGVPSISDTTQAFQRMSQQATGWDSVIAKAREVLPRIGVSTTGLIGVAQSKIPNTDAYSVAKAIETIKSNIGFDKLQNMRDLSPTGGALGQVAIQELNALQNSIAALDMGLKPEELKKNLEQVIARYEGYKKASQAAMARAELFRRRGAQDDQKPAPRRKFNPQTGMIE